MSSSATSPASWAALPAELKLAVLDRLPLADVRAFALANHDSHKLSLPTLFRTVSLKSLEDLRSYTAHVPAECTRHVRALTLTTEPEGALDAWSLPDEDRGSAALVALLSACESLQTLALRLWGCPLPAVVPAFAHLTRLHTLSITNAAPEEHLPLSERFAVAVAFSVPRLSSLALAGICRSLTHAPELLGAWPSVPLAEDDDAFVLPPAAAAALPSTSGAAPPAPRLPALLALPHLHTLALRDTHLGDAAWARAPLAAPLHTLELGACAHDADAAHATLFANPALAACPSLHTLALGAPLTSTPSPAPLSPTRAAAAPPPDARFAALTRLRIEPHFPLAGPEDDAEDSPLARTLDAFADSPLAAVDVRCFADDVPDACAGLAAALGRRRGGARVRTRASSLSSVLSADELLTPASANEDARVVVASPDADEGSGYLARLAHVGVHVVPDLLAGDEEGARAPCAPPSFDGAGDALRRLRAACGKVRLAGVLTAAMSAAAEARRCAQAPAGKVLVVL